MAASFGDNEGAGEPPDPHPRPTLNDIVARVGENGYAASLVRCVRVCKDMRDNAQLWERVVDVLHADASSGVDGDSRATRLVHWAREGDAARVRETLRRGARVNARDASGCTALYWASRGGHLGIVHELLERGADVDARRNAAA